MSVYILFDLDGTLTDPKERHQRAASNTRCRNSVFRQNAKR